MSEIETELLDAGRRMIEIDPYRARDLFQKLTSAAWDRMMGPEEEGKRRMAKALQRQEAWDHALAMVCARHAIHPDALTREHRAKQKPHVVDARAHLVFELYSTGLFSYPKLAARLGYKTHHTVMHLHDKWKARLAGTEDEAVTDKEALEVGRLAREEGITLRQACERLEVNHAKVRGRISWMRETGLWPTGKEPTNDQ